MMTNDTNQLILNSLNEIKADIKELNKSNTEIKVSIGKIETSLNWIKILFPLTFALIIFLLGVLIKVIMAMP
ncbi:MAG: hypothetical protein ACRC2S_16365 [Waterburya sp.]